MRDWKLEDILKYWSEKGSEYKSYRDLTTFLKNYNFPIAVALQFIVGLDLNSGKPLNENYLKDFKRGRLKISKAKISKADDIADRISSALTIKSLGRYGKNTAMLKSLYMLIHAENFTEKRLLHVFRTTPKAITVTPRRFDETLESIIDMFNGTMKRRRIEFNEEFPLIHESLEKRRKSIRRRAL